MSATSQTVCDSEETTSGWALNNIIMQIAAAKFYEEIIIIGLATLHNVIIHEQQNKNNFQWQSSSLYRPICLFWTFNMLQ